MLTLGAVLFPLGITLFIDPWNLNSGGLVGVSQIASWLLARNTSLTGIVNFVLNIPLFILAWRTLRRRFVIKTLYVLVIQSVMLTILPVPSHPVLPDILSSLIFGGVICGAGIGFCLQGGGCAGGIDILGMYFTKTRPDFSVGKLSYIINFFVLGAAGFLFSLQVALYSIIFIVLAYFTGDQIHLQNVNVYGFIITAKPEVKEILLKETGRGVTVWKGQGAYTGSSKEILLCIMNKYEVRQYKHLVHKADPKAFFLLSKGNPILGNFEHRLT